MELKLTNIERKNINNTGVIPEKLRGFDTGVLPASAYSNGSLWSGINQQISQRTSELKGGISPTVQSIGAGQKVTPISSTSNAKNITPVNQSENRYHYTAVPTTINGVTANAGTGSITGGSKGPTQSDSAAQGLGWQFALGSWAGGGILEGLSRLKSSDEYLAEAGTSEDNINGIFYTKQNSVDVGKAMSDYDKRTATDFLTNPFRGIASLFGRGAEKRRAELARQTALLQQGAARDDAYTKYIRLEGAKKYGDSDDQLLYAKDGKLPKFNNGLVSTGLGPVIGKANSRVSSGEVIATPLADGSYSMYRVPGIKNNRDGKLAIVGPNDYVFSNKNNASDRVWNTGDIEGTAAYMQAVGHPQRYKHGKLPGFEAGWLGNFIPSALGSLASIEQIIQAYRNKPFKPNTYASNPYELAGLQTLAGLRINPYPIMQQLRSAEARTNRSIDIAGGLSGAQRTAARLANLNTTQNNIANMLGSIQQQNNQYRANYASSLLNAGQATRQARMQANQWDLDYFSKAHAARNKGIQTGMANMLAQTQQYQANEFKRNRFNNMMRLYEGDQRQRKADMEWRNNYMSQLANNPPVQYATNTADYFGNMFKLLSSEEQEKVRRMLG